MVSPVLKAINICQTVELSKLQLRNIIETAHNQIDVISSSKGQGNNLRKHMSKQNQRGSNDVEVKGVACTRCALRHKARKCPAYENMPLRIKGAKSECGI